MSLTSALATAQSGLQATQVWSDVTSNNIANVNTQGYNAKEVAFSTTASGDSGGVQVSDIKREVDASLDAMYRLQSSQMSTQQAIYEGVQAYTAIIGQPSDGTSVVAKLTNLQTAFGTLANSPGDPAAQQGVLTAAQQVTSSLNQANSTLSEVKGEVTTEIKYNVTDLNTSLYQIAGLNKQIVAAQPGSAAAANLQDQMQQAVQSVSQAMDVQVSTGSNGQISLFTPGGTALVDGQTVNDVSYNESTGKLYSGTHEITPGTTGVRGFESGSLAGLFQLKDSILPTFQSQLDNFAGNLMKNFQSADASLAPGQAGLFTDAGSAYNAANEQGLAGRITVNAAADPTQGGSLSLIKDGLGATTPLAAGDATQVNAFLNAFSGTVTPGANTALSGAMTLTDYASNMVTYQQVAGTNAQAKYNALQTSAQTINSSRQGIEGVNLDNELQKLIVIQHSYAANAKMMSTISSMMDSLIQAV